MGLFSQFCVVAPAGLSADAYSGTSAAPRVVSLPPAACLPRWAFGAIIAAPPRVATGCHEWSRKRAHSHWHPVPPWLRNRTVPGGWPLSG